MPGTASVLHALCQSDLETHADDLRPNFSIVILATGAKYDHMMLQVYMPSLPAFPLCALQKE